MQNAINVTVIRAALVDNTGWNGPRAFLFISPSCILYPESVFRFVERSLCGLLEICAFYDNLSGDLNATMAPPPRTLIIQKHSARTTGHIQFVTELNGNVGVFEVPRSVRIS